MASFPPTRSQNTLFWPIFLKNKTGQNIQFLTTNHGLTPSEKFQIFVFLNGCFSNLKWLIYYLEVYKTLRLVFFCWKTKRTKFLIFDQQPWRKKQSFFCICKFALFAWIKGSEVVSATCWWLITKCKGPTNKN